MLGRRRPTFEQIKRNLDKGRYRRMDKFQEDMFEVFEYARKYSRTDSQVKSVGMVFACFALCGSNK